MGHIAEGALDMSNSFESQMHLTKSPSHVIDKEKEEGQAEGDSSPP